MISNELIEKYNILKEYINQQGNAVVAFSAGVDSTFLLKVAQDVLRDNVIAVTISSYSFPKRELIETENFCKKINVKHFIIKIDELIIEGFSKNPANRCYLCKRELFKKIWEVAKSNNIENVFEGSNIDDDNDYRPGLIAIKELNIKSPLKYAKLTKNEIRILSKELELQTFNKPSYACLASRFVYGETITKEKLETVDKSEQFMIDMGFRQVRVRIHNNIARIEVTKDEFKKLLNHSCIITEKLKSYGFKYVTMDLEGYRTGSMNEVLK